MCFPGSLAAAQHALDDWELLWSVRTNALMVGPHHETAAVLAALLPSLDAPVSRVITGAHFALPPAGHSGSVILEDLSGFTVPEQQRLLEWLDMNGRRARVISTSTRAMTRSIADREFLPALYYRLNGLYLEVGCIGASQI
jgi:hypothetical protein